MHKTVSRIDHILAFAIASNFMCVATGDSITPDHAWIVSKLRSGTVKQRSKSGRLNPSLLQDKSILTVQGKIELEITI